MTGRIIGTATIAGLALIALVALAPHAVAQKGVLGTGAPTGKGLLSPDGTVRYVAAAAGANTFVGRTATDGGRVERSLVLNGRFAIPAVAEDGSAAGLSADHRRLVLAQQGIRFPRERSRFAVVEPERMRLLDTIVLEGTFTFDAISPDGRTLYLIEYVSPRDISRYQVRAYDMRRGQLRPQPILDADVAAEIMRGSPVTRATSPDGRWAYTLYSNREPFIHALDTERGSAVCIVLDQGFIERRRVWRMRLDPSLDGSTLAVVRGGAPVALVDTETFEVSEPPVETDAATSEADQSGGMPWIPLALIGLMAAALAGAVRRWRRSRAVDPSELERLVDVDGGTGQAAVETEEEASQTEGRAVEPEGRPVEPEGREAETEERVREWDPVP